MPCAVTAGAEPAGIITRNPPPDTIDDISLGLEVKFLLLGLPLSEQAALERTHRSTRIDIADRSQRQAYAGIARVIERPRRDSATAAAAAATAASNGNGIAMIHDTTAQCQPRAVSRYDIADTARQEREFWHSHWIVKKANSVEYSDTDPRPDMRRTNGDVVSVEMSSPTFSWTDKSAPHWIREVILRTKTLPVTVNHTCDIHVHVGRGDGVAFSLTTLKKLATVFWLAEPILRSVRDPSSPNYDHTYTWGFAQRQCSRLALALEGRVVAADNVSIGRDMLARVRAGPGRREEEEEWNRYMRETGRAARRNEALRAIWRTVSPLELGLLLSGTQREHRRLGFNFSAFGQEDERARTNPRTIEYRFLQSTLQEELILGWLRICGKMVELAMKGNQGRFREVVRYLLSQQSEYDAFGVPRTTGCPRHMPRDVLFKDLMDRIGVEAASYTPFQVKMRQEYGLS